MLARILARDVRYTSDAYRFIFEALDFTLKNVGRTGHVSGRELLEGVRVHALDQFGGLAPMVFNTWGVRSTDDFGEIVFNLVDGGLMGKTQTDTKADFHGVYDFDDAFAVRPETKRAR